MQTRAVNQTTFFVRDKEMFATSMLKRAFRSISGALTPSSARVTRQKIEAPIEALDDFHNSFLGGTPITYAVLEHEPPLTVPVRPEEHHVLADIHRHFMGLPTNVLT